MRSNVLEKVTEFKRRYPLSIGWRIKKHAKIIDVHLGDDEEILYAFVAQKNDNPFDIITTNIVALTNKRIMIGQKRLIFGYFFDWVTPDLFNDLSVKSGIIWGKLYIDTMKEEVKLSNIDKRAIPEIEEAIVKYMVDQKDKKGE